MGARFDLCQPRLQFAAAVCHRTASIGQFIQLGVGGYFFGGGMDACAQCGHAVSQFGNAIAEPLRAIGKLRLAVACTLQACFQLQRTGGQFAGAIRDFSAHDGNAFGLVAHLRATIGQFLGPSLQVLQALGQRGVAFDQISATSLQCGQVLRSGQGMVHGAQASAELLDAIGQLPHRATQTVGPGGELARATFGLGQALVKSAGTAVECLYPFAQLRQFVDGACGRGQHQRPALLVQVDVDLVAQFGRKAFGEACTVVVVAL